MNTQLVDSFATTLWSYHSLHQPLERADVLLVLGSNDLRIPLYASTLYKKGLAPIIVVSGGIAHTNDLLKTSWEGTEAEKFSQVLRENGVPDHSIIKEEQAKNLGENFTLSRKLLEHNQISFQTAIIVTKPFVERRAFSAAQHWWPDKKVVISSPDLSFDTYANEVITKEDLINLLVGYTQRIDVYGRTGHQIPQEIPENVWHAFQQLKELGFTKHMLSDKTIRALS